MSGRQPASSPRKIVLLSDGTGNSSAKLMKTNVWRLYEAIDTSRGDQVAFYDNGVGTSSIGLLAMLGGALGWGLKRNVRDLYMFACRNYRPADAGRAADEMFAFGFSRGAFTIRVLLGLIESQGLIRNAHGPELKRLAKWAYRDYRRQFTSQLRLLTPFRWLRDVLLRLKERGKPVYDKRKNTRAPITFVGLWDTVDAYGLPIDEMTRGWDKFVWPLSMCERRVKNVKKFCHVMALDDERHTFHPVLLTEDDQQPVADHIDREAVTQVWFAGVHSNVGGGYPDDSLAHVSLRWMADEASKHGLRLHDVMTEQWRARLDPNGQLYDSRGGLGSYYRYHPRKISRLADDPFAGVRIPRPKIHHSVFDRIAAGRDEYAPIVVPERYAVVARDGSLLEGDRNPYEHPTQGTSRCADQERVWNLVWLRRVLYFATVLFTLILLLPPLVVTPDSVKAYLATIHFARLGIAEAVVNALRPLAPSMLAPWVDFYSELPEVLAVLGAPIIGLLIASTYVQSHLEYRMWRIWHPILSAPPKVVTPNAPPTDLLYRVRTHRAYQRLSTAFSKQIFPFVFGVLTLSTLVLAGVGTLNRAEFAIASAAGAVCQQPNAAVILSEQRQFALNPRAQCIATGVNLEAGATYRARTMLPSGGWYDGGQHVASPAGFSSGDNPKLLPWLPFRRVLREQWFVPIARVGNFPTEHHALNRDEVVFMPRVGGPLYLFVNDAVFFWPSRWWSYRNNDTRAAQITIEKLQPSAATTSAGRVSSASTP
jgi:uncharacterized protein (DUF2235 family)